MLLDLRLKDGEALELIAALKFQLPQLFILVLSQCDEALYAEKALRAGADGYLMKQEAADELLNAVRTVLQGKLYLSQAVHRQLFRDRPASVLATLESLRRAVSGGVHEGSGGNAITD